MLADTVLSAFDGYREYRDDTGNRKGSKRIAALRDHKSSTWRMASAGTTIAKRTEITVPIGDP
jgi:hypothetical protein